MNRIGSRLEQLAVVMSTLFGQMERTFSIERAAMRVPLLPRPPETLTAWGFLTWAGYADHFSPDSAVQRVPPYLSALRVKCSFPRVSECESFAVINWLA